MKHTDYFPLGGYWVVKISRKCQVNIINEQLIIGLIHTLSILLSQFKKNDMRSELLTPPKE